MVYHSDEKMRSYYKNRAPVYDRVYSYQERQTDLRFLEQTIPQRLSGKNVIEIAAGTGYWTQFIAKKAKSVLATDVTEEALKQIEKRELPKSVVSKKVADAYSLHQLPGKFDGAFAGLWISHIPKERLEAFFTSLHRILLPGAIVVFIDNSAAQCTRLPLNYTDEQGNTYQNRELDDGSIHQVLKNFPTKKELHAMTHGFGEEHQYIALENFWLFQYVAN